MFIRGLKIIVFSTSSRGVSGKRIANPDSDVEQFNCEGEGWSYRRWKKEGESSVKFPNSSMHLCKKGLLNLLAVGDTI